jgi:hypothetical protein
MKTKLFALIIILGFGLSCSNDPEESTPSLDVVVLQTEDWYAKIGLDYVAQNESLPSNVKNAIKKSDYKGFGGSYAYETYHYANGVVSHMIASKNIPGEYLVVSKTTDNKFNLVTMSVTNQIVTYTQNGKKLIDFDLNARTSSKTNVAYPGNCSELGPKRNNEEFSECLVRNLENFCCDFTGCAAIVAMPTAVAAACTIACTGAFPE